ncbi:GGDEF domain-containing protein [Aggregicoccus sp. 17bor-14]|uniref:GGDEF domain-containing protein n=1 Tax=Myxococcaceae TaxID=31 RepID=UPI00129CC605|nr:MULTISPECIES: GGDEF domain-containing protein [Myxococcaceae]MBF5042732.1 GGDEF domain-containing protein [Simulacricoccus sp. 17bor-14]MRI88500.1 GGDEF domain-containing protein [Aggregicoccus sp. 17bor-14]
MPYPLDDATANRLVNLFPRVLQREREPVQAALTLLLEAEEARRGAPDATGALGALALLQGTVLKEEYDLSTHAHHDAWRVDALVADVRGLIHVNARHGFAAGDALLRGVVGALKGAFPGARVVRLHGDCFAALLVPSSGLQLDEGAGNGSAARAEAALTEAARAALPAGAELPGFTLAQLSLAVRSPSHWQVLGPLVWAELERAFALARMGGERGVQRRTLELAGAVPLTP